MNFQNITLKSKEDGIDIDVLYVLPEGEIKGLFAISHGMAEHKERYLPFMDYLAKQGYLVFINDHRGHGKSIKTQDDLGYFYDDKGNYIVEDLFMINTYFKEHYPSLPLYLFGHSMGSLIVRKYLQKYDDTLTKLIVRGSPSKNPLVKVACFVVDVMSRFKGDRYRSPLINALAFGSYDKKFEGDLPNRWLSKNEENVLNYNKNEKDGFIFTLNGFKNLFLIMAEVYDKKMYHPQNPDLPILFIAGKDDPVIISLSKWHEAIMFLKDAGYKNVEGQLYNDMRHEILNETAKEEVYKDILYFIES